MLPVHLYAGASVPRYCGDRKGHRYPGTRYGPARMTWCGHAPGEYPNIHSKNRPEHPGVHASAKFSVLDLVVYILDLLNLVLNLASSTCWGIYSCVHIPVHAGGHKIIYKIVQSTKFSTWYYIF